MVTSSRSIGIDFAKNLYNSLRSDSSNLMMFLGGFTASSVEQNTIDDDNDVWNEINFLKNIRESDMSVIARRVDWSSGSVYYPYASSGIPTGATGTQRNFYAMTDDREVFLCMSGNENNRSDLFGQSASTVKPSRTTDNTVLSDGYRWKFLYKLDLAHSKFLTSNYIPVIDLDDYDETSGSSTVQEEALRSGCGISAGMSGSCCFYFNEDSIDPITDVVYRKGDLDFCVDDIQCSKCFSYSRNLNRKYNFTRFGTCDKNACASSKTIRKGYELILADRKRINPSRGNFLQAEVYKSAVDNDGQIQSVSIDLSGLTDTDLTTTTESPIVTVSSSTGSGAVIRLQTRNSGVVNGVQQYVITGISLSSAGSGYRDINIVSVSNSLSSRIKINLDYVGGLGANPRHALNATKFMIATTIRSDKLPTEAGTLQTTFTRHGLIRDVLVKASNQSGLSAEYIAGSNANRDEEKILSNLTKLELQQGLSSFRFTSGSETFARGDLLTNSTTLTTTEENAVTTANKTVGKTAKVTNFRQTTNLSLSGGADLELIAPSDDIFSVGDTILSNSAETKTNFTINAVTKPDVKAFTGKVVASNTTNVTITDQPRELLFRYVYSLGSY